MSKFALSKKQMLTEIAKLPEKKGVRDVPVLEEIKVADGSTYAQLQNHHKKLMNVYSSLPEPLLWQEYNIMKHQVEKKEAQDVNSSSD